MSTRVYLSNVWPWLSIEAQRKALGEVIGGAEVFMDRLDARERQAHQITSLVERNRMTRRTSRRRDGEEVHVASLAVLAWGEADLLACVEAIKARGAALHWHDGVPLGDVLEAWRASRVRTRQKGAMQKAALASAAKKEAAAIEACARIKERWERPTEGFGQTLALIAETGFSRNTVNKHIGSRRAAQALYQRKMNRRKKNDE